MKQKRDSNNIIFLKACISVAVLLAGIWGALTIFPERIIDTPIGSLTIDMLLRAFVAVALAVVSIKVGLRFMEDDVDRAEREETTASK